VKVSKLTGAQLDYWVARAAGHEGQIVKSHSPCNADYFEYASGTPYRPSTHWAHGGPLIEKYRLAVNPFYYKHNNGWVVTDADDGILSDGETPLEAVCREVVRAKFGDDVPDDEGAT
jgi:hypothetical protein